MDLTPKLGMFNLNTNSKIIIQPIHQMKEQRIRKTTSLLAFKTIPAQQIVFNPRQFQVGESRISRLPQRTLPRRNSLATLSRTEKPTPLKQSKQLELTLLKALNEKLIKENSQLKNELEMYKKISRSNSSKGKSSYMSEESSKAELNLKNIVVEKINRTKCSSRLASDNQTGLYSSKQVSYNNESETINEMYENLMRGARPSLQQYQEQLKKFFNDFEQTFIHLKHLFEGIPKQQKLNDPASQNQCQSLLETINEIFQAKIQKEKVAKNPIFVEKGRSRPKVERQPTREKVQEKEDILELLSPEQVIERFEKYIEKVLKSQRIMKNLKSSLIVRKFTKKLSEV